MPKKKGIFKYSDLPQTLQDELLAIETNSDFDWWEDAYTTFKETMESDYGITISLNDIYFSGFWSQGDGASFTTKNGVIDSLKFIRTSGFDFDFGYEASEFLEEFTSIRNLYEEVTEKFITLHVVSLGGRHSHEYNVCGEVVNEMTCDDIDSKVHVFVEKLEEHLTSFIRNKCRELYDALEKDYKSMFDSSVALARLEACTWDKEYNLVSQ